MSDSSGGGDYFYIFFFLWLGLVCCIVVTRRICLLVAQSRRNNNSPPSPDEFDVHGAVVAHAVIITPNRQSDNQSNCVYIINNNSDGNEQNDTIVTAKPSDVIVVGSPSHTYNSLHDENSIYCAEAYTLDDENGRRV